MVRRVFAFFLLAMLAAVPAHAISITLDNPNQSVFRPSVGSVSVDYTGTVVIDAGFNLDLLSLSSINDAFGHQLAVPFPQPTLSLTGVLFRVIVSASDVPGLYAFQIDGVSPLSVTYFECPVGGGLCQGATGDYSINVVAPEPALLGLVAAGLAGAIARRSRARHAQVPSNG